MADGKLKRKCNSLIAGLLIVSLLLSLTGIILVLLMKKRSFDYRAARLDVNQFVMTMEETLNSGSAAGITEHNLDGLKDYPFHAILIDLKGKVLWTKGDTEYKVGDKYPLRTLSGINMEVMEKGIYQYIAPILIEDTQSYTVIVSIPSEEYIKHEYLHYPLLFFIIVLFLVSVYMVCKFTGILKHSIFKPIKALHEVTGNILIGNLETPLTYDYDDEVGTLCHDFEMMRTELLNGSNRAKQLKDNEKLLLACISHDLKTPLSSISAYVEGIREGIVTDEDGIKRYTSIILNKVKILTKLIDDILEHSKTELNELSIQREEVYSKQYFTKIFEELSLDIVQAGIEFTISEIPDYLLNIDVKRIRQVIYNIISNSIKYTPEGGKIQISFFTNNRASKEELVISIKDTGEGISASDLPFIFDKFYRGEKARTLNIAGSGLGLNIAKYIVTKHGGYIECDSILDVGTTIMFSLPL